jgi:hypothetical protein
LTLRYEVFVLHGRYGNRDTADLVANCGKNGILQMTQGIAARIVRSWRAALPEESVEFPDLN